MSKSQGVRPTDAELAILHVLWEHGPCTVRQVQQEHSRSSTIGYTTVLKLLQIMTDKGLVLRDESQRSHVYRTKFKQDRTQRQLLGDLLEKAFGGSAEKLVLQALSIKNIPSDELARIRRLLDELEGGAS